MATTSAPAPWRPVKRSSPSVSSSTTSWSSGLAARRSPLCEARPLPSSPPAPRGSQDLYPHRTRSVMNHPITHSTPTRSRSYRSTAATRREERGSVLVIILILTIAFGFLMTFFLEENQVQARATRFRLSSMRALYQAYAELEKAQRIITVSPYDADGHNLALTTAVAAADKKLAGADVAVEKLTGVTGSWYKLTAAVPYEDARRVVSQAVREVDFFSSYNLFVANDPAGISGSPVGAIHSNKTIQFY